MVDSTGTELYSGDAVDGSTLSPGQTLAPETPGNWDRVDYQIDGRPIYPGNGWSERKLPYFAGGTITVGRLPLCAQWLPADSLPHLVTVSAVKAGAVVGRVQVTLTFTPVTV